MSFQATTNSSVTSLMKRVAWLLVFALLSLGRVVIADDARGIMSQVREERERLVCYDVKFSFTRHGKQKQSRQVGDFLAGVHRCDFGAPDRHSVILHRDHMISSSVPEGGSSFVIIRDRNLSAIGFDRIVDVRAIGTTNIISNQDVDVLSTIWQKQCDSPDMFVLHELAGVSKVAVQVTFGGADSTFPGVRVFTVDKRRGHAVTDVDLYAGITLEALKSAFEAGVLPERTSVIHTDWKEFDGCWVPVLSAETSQPDGADSISKEPDETVRLDWATVNEPQDSVEFSYSAFAIPGAQVYDYRADPPVLVESVPATLPPAIALESSSDTAYLRWVLLGLGVLLGVLALIGFVWSRGSSGRVR